MKSMEPKSINKIEIPQLKLRDIKLPPIYRWLISIPLGLSLFFVFSLNWQDLLLSVLDLQTRLLLLIILILIITNSITHEYTHKAFATLFKYKSVVRIKQRRCIVYGRITPIHFLITVLAPQMLYTLLIILLISIFPHLIIWISLYIVIAIDSSKSDLYMGKNVFPYCFKNNEFYLEYQDDGCYGLFQK